MNAAAQRTVDSRAPGRRRPNTAAAHREEPGRQVFWKREFGPGRPVFRNGGSIVLLTFFFVPSRQFSICFVHEQTFQTWY